MKRSSSPKLLLGSLLLICLLATLLSSRTLALKLNGGKNKKITLDLNLNGINGLSSSGSAAAASSSSAAAAVGGQQQQQPIVIQSPQQQQQQQQQQQFTTQPITVKIPPFKFPCASKCCGMKKKENKTTIIVEIHHKKKSLKRRKQSKCSKKENKSLASQIKSIFRIKYQKGKKFHPKKHLNTNLLVLFAHLKKNRSIPKCRNNTKPKLTKSVKKMVKIIFKWNNKPKKGKKKPTTKPKKCKTKKEKKKPKKNPKKCKSKKEKKKPTTKPKKDTKKKKEKKPKKKISKKTIEMLKYLAKCGKKKSVTIKKKVVENQTIDSIFSKKK